MSTELPPPPQVSPDGKFYWDGSKWVPMQASSPAPQAVAPVPSVQAFPQMPPVTAQAGQPSAAQSHTMRNVSIGCLGLIALLIVIALIGNGAHNANNAAAPKIDLSGESSRTAVVGGRDEVAITVTDKGPTDFQTLIVYLNSKDDWFKHHVITDPSGCTINKDLERLECGPLKVGETRTLNIVGSPKDAGNFDFEIGIADEEGSTLLYPDGDALDWSEAITLS